MSVLRASCDGRQGLRSIRIAQCILRGESWQLQQPAARRRSDSYGVALRGMLCKTAQAAALGQIAHIIPRVLLLQERLRSEEVSISIRAEPLTTISEGSMMRRAVVLL